MGVVLAATTDDDVFGGFFESDTWTVARNLGTSVRTVRRGGPSDGAAREGLLP